MRSKTAQILSVILQLLQLVAHRQALYVFDPIFPDTFYHLFHYELDAAGTLAENDNPVHCEDA
ncbi:hypothetical protein, partial [Providencia rettgeri]|uniref:hypothetical protein n=1 Tax=Providencia rettgeri TaxID=587 RepID=UPI003017261E